MYLTAINHTADGHPTQPKLTIYFFCYSTFFVRSRPTFDFREGRLGGGTLPTIASSSSGNVVSQI